jgi:tetratricopeptide (TPR) repeat protein
MNVPLDTPVKRRALIAGSALVAAIFAYSAVKLALASNRMYSEDPAEMKSAIALEPGYAEYWDRMGRLLQFELDAQDLPGALKDYQTAVKLSPRTARYWVDLAVVQENLGDVQQARDDFAQALAAYPASAEIRWEYANFLLRQGELSGALAEMRKSIAGDPSLLPLAVTRAWRATGDADELAANVLPRDSNAYLNTLDFFAEEKNVDAGLRIWSHLAALHQEFPIEKLFPFFEEMIRENRASDAQRVWGEALEICGIPHERLRDELLFNGGFENDLLNGGLDWRLSPGVGMSVEYDTLVHHGGLRSLRMDFNGGVNLDLSEPLQFVPVEPEHFYRFHAYLRTDAISTESGFHFEIFDPTRRGEITARTDDLNGTHLWTGMDAEIHTGPQTEFLEVLLRRTPSRMFENKLSGTVWIDDASLSPASNSDSAGTSRTRGTR